MIAATNPRADRFERVAPCSSGDQRISALIADHDGLARRMMCDALQDGGIMVAATARETGEALQLVRHYRPTIVLADTSLPGHGGVWLVQKVMDDLPGTRVLTVSADEDDETIVAALRAGAAGHIGKDIEPDDLVRLIGLAVADEAIVPRRLLPPLLGLVRMVPDTGWRPVHSRLTTREWEIVELLCADVSTISIAECLVLSTSTVYSHIKSILRKLGVHSRGEAVVAAERLRREEALGTNPPIAVL
jgi:two-component system nitrate/nitrite response regulator NarL